MPNPRSLTVVAAAAAFTLFLPRTGASQQPKASSGGAPTSAVPLARPDSIPPAVPLAAVDRTKFEGDYDIGLPDGRILPFRIFTEGEELMGQAEGQGKAPLKYLGDDTFGADFDPTVRFKFTVEGGRVVSAKLMQRGATMNVTRRP